MPDRANLAALAEEATRRAEQAEQRFSALINADVIGVTISDEHDLLESNDAFLELTGYTRADLQAGLSWAEMTPPEWKDADARALADLRERGAAPAYEKEYVRKDGSRVPVLVSGALVQADPFEVVATIHDLTDRKAVEREISTLLDRERDARFAAELATARMGRLQEITAELSASISAAAIARVVLHHALEDLSASAGLLSLQEDGALSIAHAVGFATARVEEWRRFPMSMPAPVIATLRMSEPDIATGGDPDGDGLVVAVPLMTGGRPLGAICICFREARVLTGEDREFLLALGRQAAAAVERAQLFENRAYVAKKLQEGLLPDRLAPIPGMESAVRYTSITGGGEVGGDFYDVFQVDEGRWALAIGDVCGKGTDAAVITGLARHTVRAIALVKDSPREILAFLNGAIRRHSAIPAFCTVGVALVEPARDGAFRVSAASGGHPPPLVLRADGTVEAIDVSGTMLGVAADPDLADVDCVLGPGDALVEYTDGVVDARRPGGELFGDARLLAALRAAAGQDAEGIAASIENAVRAHHPDAPADDRAIVVLRVTP